MSVRLFMTEADVRLALVRIAHEIVETHRGSRDLVIIGMRTRGVPLSRRIARAIEEIEGEKVPLGILDIGFYRDDLSARGMAVQIAPSDIPDIAGKRVVIRSEERRVGKEYQYHR